MSESVGIMGTNQEPLHGRFKETVLLLRAKYQTMRERTNLFAPTGRQLIAQCSEVVEGRRIETYWLHDGTPLGKCVRLWDIPGTFSGDILRLRRDLPLFNGHLEIDGDTTRIIECPPHPEEDDDDDSEDISAALGELPLIQVDPSKHFVKRGKYRSEIENLLKCQRGACPGEPLSPHIVQLLGKSSEGELVFERLTICYVVLSTYCSIAVYKRWILHLIAGLICLHSLGIIHRDLRIANMVFSVDDKRLVICDLESHWGNRCAPEVARNGGLNDSGWTEKSDIYDIGHCIKGFIYANAPITRQVEWPVPQPFDRIVEACLRAAPEERPSLDELSVMVERIEE